MLVRSKKSIIILCLLVISDHIMEGYAKKKNSEREIEISYSHKKEENEDEDSDGSEPHEAEGGAGGKGKGGGGDDDEGDGDGSGGDDDANGGGDGGDDDGDDDDGSGGGGKGGKGKKNSGMDKNKIKDGKFKNLPNKAFPRTGGAISNIAGTGNQRIKKRTMSGLMMALDDRLTQIDRFCDPQWGMPEDALGHVLYCAQFIYSGLYAVVYLHIRWPLKIVQKLVLYTGGVGHLIAYANRCVNPIYIMDFATMGRRHNAHLEKLGEIKKEWKTRLMWITDHSEPNNRQMYVCCTWADMRKKVYAELPEVMSWAKWHYNELYMLANLVFCLQYQIDSQACEEVDISVTDAQPERVVANSMLTPVIEMLNTFV